MVLKKTQVRKSIQKIWVQNWIKSEYMTAIGRKTQSLRMHDWGQQHQRRPKETVLPGFKLHILLGLKIVGEVWNYLSTQLNTI